MRRVWVRGHENVRKRVPAGRKMKRSAAAATMRVSKRRFGVQEVRPAGGRTALGGSASGAVADAVDAIFADAKAFLDSPEAGQMSPERPRAGAGPAAPGVGRQPPACVPGRAQPRAGRRSGRHRCRERRAVRARRRGIALRRDAGRAPGRHAVRHWPADAGRYRVAGTAAQAVMTVFDRVHGKAVRRWRLCSVTGRARVGVPPDDAIRAAESGAGCSCSPRAGVVCGGRCDLRRDQGLRPFARSVADE